MNKSFFALILGLLAFPILVSAQSSETEILEEEIQLEEFSLIEEETSLQQLEQEIIDRRAALQEQRRSIIELKEKLVELQRQSNVLDAKQALPLSLQRNVFTGADGVSRTKGTLRPVRRSSRFNKSRLRLPVRKKPSSQVEASNLTPDETIRQNRVRQNVSTRTANQLIFTRRRGRNASTRRFGRFSGKVPARGTKSQAHIFKGPEN